LEDQTKSVPTLPKDRKGEIGWQVRVSKQGNYDLSQAFQTSFDDNVKLELGAELDFLNGTRTEQVFVEPVVYTDGSALCDIMLEKAETEAEKEFWQATTTCQTLVKIIAPDTFAQGYADRNGTFSLPYPNNTFQLKPGKNLIKITVKDPSGNTKEALVEVTRRTPDELTIPDLLEEDPEVVFVCVVIFIIIVGAGTIIYVKTKTKKQLKETFQKKEKQEQQSRYQYLKERKKILKETIARLEKKAVNIGLTKEEETDKRTYENELVRIEDELLNNDEFLRELARRSSKAYQDAKNGTPSSKIRKDLIREGYSERDIKLIHKLFKKLKKGEV
jgi:hypothetical protein